MSYRSKRHTYQERKANNTRGNLLVVDEYTIRIRAKRNDANMNPWHYWNERRECRAVQKCWKWQRKVKKQYQRV